MLLAHQLLQGSLVLAPAIKRFGRFVMRFFGPSVATMSDAEAPPVPPPPQRVRVELPQESRASFANECPSSPCSC